MISEKQIEDEAKEYAKSFGHGSTADYSWCVRDFKAGAHFVLKELEAELLRQQKLVLHYKELLYGHKDMGQELSKSLQREEIYKKALTNWLEWEDAQIKEHGEYHGIAINKLIDEGRCALKDAEAIK